jgi:hypothetical protein
MAVPSVPKQLPAQTRTEFNLWHEIAEKSSKIVLLGAPLFSPRFSITSKATLTFLSNQGPC